MWRRVSDCSTVGEGDDETFTVRSGDLTGHICGFGVECMSEICPQLPSLWNRKTWNDIQLVKMVMIMKDFYWRIRLISAELRFFDSL